MSRCKLEEFISYEQPAKYIVNSNQYDDSYETPVLTAGKSFILGYTDEKNNIFDNLPVIIFDDFTTSVQFVDFPFKVKSSAMKLLKNTEQADIKYCYYLLKFLQHTPENHKRQWLSATSQNIVELPTIEKQKNIVRKLDKILEVIDDQNKQLELLDEAIKARFVEMFGDPVVNDKKWEIRYFSDLGELKRGKSKHRPRNDPILLGGKYPLIQTGDVTNSNTYIKSYTSTYSEEGLKQSKMWKKGTLCITIAANIAESAILTFDACFPDSVVGFTPNGEVISLFIHYWLSFLQPILEENAPAVAQKNLNVATLEKVGVIVPPLELQNQFASFVQEIDKSRSRIQKSLEASQELFDSLMQEYFG